MFVKNSGNFAPTKPRQNAPKPASLGAAPVWLFSDPASTFSPPPSEEARAPLPVSMVKAPPQPRSRPPPDPSPCKLSVPLETLTPSEPPEPPDPPDAIFTLFFLPSSMNPYTPLLIWLPKLWIWSPLSQIWRLKLLVVSSLVCPRGEFSPESYVHRTPASSTPLFRRMMQRSQALQAFDL
ncbi:hypothetical protein DY000_02063318 [Brassica cretica]|uniref:Uncharacterized protein n=1 Tax=Brassica cretica TaxID=69181 RepID=A0ABQ7AVM7_BRACR|nr:hypothetical protein DY000_02063318 [Brassica cretica]